MRVAKLRENFDEVANIAKLNPISYKYFMSRLLLEEKALNRISTTNLKNNISLPTVTPNTDIVLPPLVKKQKNSKSINTNRSPMNKKNSYQQVAILDNTHKKIRLWRQSKREREEGKDREGGNKSKSLDFGPNFPQIPQLTDVSISLKYSS